MNLNQVSEKLKQQSQSDLLFMLDIDNQEFCEMFKISSSDIVNKFLEKIEDKLDDLEIELDD